MNSNQINNGLNAEGSERKYWAAGCHGSALFGLMIPFGNLIGPILVWLLKKDEIEEVNYEGKSAINFQLLATAASTGIFLMSFGLGGISYAFVSLYWLRYAVSILGIGLSVVKAIKIYENKNFEYPIRYEFIK